MAKKFASILLCSLLILRSASAELLQNGTSWGELQISPKAIDYMPYRNSHVAIYESLKNQRLLPGNDNQRQYFCTPILLLQPNKATYKYINATRQHAITFHIVMWNDHINQAVYDYMNKEMNITVEKRQIKPIPFDNILLVCSTAADSCKCKKEWRPYHMQNVVHFNMVCPSMSEAMSLTEVFQNDPEQFQTMFTMMFSLSTSKWKQREAVINVRNIYNGKLMSELEQRFPTKSEVLLTAEDANKLLAQSQSNVMFQIYVENDDVIDDRSETYIHKMLEQMMVKGQTKVDSDFKLWDTVFWNADSYRPDELAHELNESYKKLDNKNQKRLVDAAVKASKNASDSAHVARLLKSRQQETNLKSETDTSDSISEDRAEKIDEFNSLSTSNGRQEQTRDAASAGLSAGYAGVSVGMNLTAEKERLNSTSNTEQKQSDVTKETAEKKQEEKKNRKEDELSHASSDSFMEERQSNVISDNEDSDARNKETDEIIREIEESISKIEWNGKKFVPKPMTLTRINLARMRSDQTFEDRKMSVSFALAMLSLPVNIDLDSQSNDRNQYEELHSKMQQLYDQLFRISVTVRKSFVDLKETSLTVTKELRNEMGTLKEDLLKQESTLKEIINQEKVSLRQELGSSLSAFNHSTHQDLAAIKKDLSNTGTKTKALNEAVVQVRSNISGIETELMSAVANLNGSVFSTLKKKVFFSATGRGTSGTNKTVAYNIADLINVGWEVSASEGAFVVPRDGHYALFFNAVATKNTITSLKCNEQQLFSTVTRLDREGESVISLSTVQRLKANDKISIFLQEGELKSYSTFQFKYSADSYVPRLYDTIAFSGFSID